MITRAATDTMLKNLSVFPAANIIGPRQVGKTTLAKHLQTRLGKPSIYLDLQDEQDLDKLASPSLFLREHTEKCVAIDEIQRLPMLYGQLRSLIDERRDPARFILLGSASPSIIKGGAESLAGRVFFTELMPLSLLEAEGIASWQVHWVRGGFPNVLAAGVRPLPNTLTCWKVDFWSTGSCPGAPIRANAWSKRLKSISGIPGCCITYCGFAVMMHSWAILRWMSALPATYIVLKSSFHLPR